MPAKFSNDEARAKSKAVGITMIGNYVGSKAHTAHRCPECDNENWFPRPSSVWNKGTTSCCNKGKREAGVKLNIVKIKKRLLNLGTGIKLVEGQTYKNFNTPFNFICHCGNEFSCRVSSILMQLTTSCGCRRKGSNSCHYKGYKCLSGTKWQAIKKSAKRRNIPFDLSIQEAWELFEKQKRKCYLTQQSIILCPSRKDIMKGKQTASLDRIDSSKGYTIDNVQWIHKDLNTMKWDFSQEHFINMCKMVAKHN